MNGKNIILLKQNDLFGVMHRACQTVCKTELHGLRVSSTPLPSLFLVFFAVSNEI